METVLTWAQESENRVGRKWEGAECDMGLRCQQLVFELTLVKILFLLQLFWRSPETAQKTFTWPPVVVGVVSVSHS